MIILKTSGWEDYELIDSGDGKRLERFGKYTLVRPDPQIIWKIKKPQLWQKADASFEKDGGEKGNWKVKTKMPRAWDVKYKDLTFLCKLTPFKHTGVFPEQHLQWDFVTEQILKRVQDDKKKSEIASSKTPRNDGRPNVLNLFGYTGIASLAAAKAGASVTHVDGSYPTIGWARENQKAAKLESKPIRWILDDAIKFCQREVKRSTKYDGIIMDPPIFGHGPKGERWDFNESFPKLLELCKQLLSSTPLFILINAYAISSSALMLENMLKDFTVGMGGEIEVGELALQEKDSDRLLSTGIFGRWKK